MLPKVRILNFLKKMKLELEDKCCFIWKDRIYGFWRRVQCIVLVNTVKKLLFALSFD